MEVLMLLRSVLGIAAAFIFLAKGSHAQKFDRIDLAAFSGANAWSVLVARDQGFLKKRNINLRIHEVDDYAEMVRLKRDGRVQMSIVAYDNLMAIKPGMPRLVSVVILRKAASS